MQNGTVGTSWQRFARKVTGLWRDPVENDFSMIAAASLKQEKEAAAPPSPPEAQLTAWEDEGGMTAGTIPSPRRSSDKRRRPTYSP